MTRSRVVMSPVYPRPPAPRCEPANSSPSIPHRMADTAGITCTDICFDFTLVPWMLP